MAKGFWRKAYELELGHAPPASGNGTDDGPVAASVPPPSQELPQVDGLPTLLQPGRISTMQPVDAKKDRKDLITDPDYWAQPKRDGRRLAVIATPTHIYYQSRSLNLQPSPAIEFDQALLAAVSEHGMFILDGELYYADALGGEHRTGAQAATVNLAEGLSHVQPKPCLAIFKALFAGDRDLTNTLESERIAAGERIGGWLAAQAPDFFEVLPTAKTEEEKRQLVAAQQAEGREGEVWRSKLLRATNCCAGCRRCRGGRRRWPSGLSRDGGRARNWKACSWN